MTCSTFNSHYKLYRRYQIVAVQSWDNEVAQASNPDTDNVPTPPSEEELKAVVDEDIYYKNKLKINDNIFNNPPPLFKTATDIQLETLETYVQVKLYLLPIPYIGLAC